MTGRRSILSSYYARSETYLATPFTRSHDQFSLSNIPKMTAFVFPARDEPKMAFKVTFSALSTLVVMKTSYR